MSVAPEKLSQKNQPLKNFAGELITRGPLPGSRKIHVPGVAHPQLRVPMREISVAPKTNGPGSVVVYDASGAYTDPAVEIDVRRGLDPIRAPWIEARGDSEQLAKLTSEYGQRRLADHGIDHLRFEHLRPP
ncbi:MAG TPA: phosphomethylpyrimidine synthase ThiC, partial [Candidatus Sumerlaeota bacterium]|nr:phosphomethylpyrimidine synthase ThiC [Candidatus Sumerlaeota bacterium]